MGEQWRAVIDPDNGWYEVSDHGTVRSVDRLVEYRDGRKPRPFPGMVLTPHVNKRGYHVYSLYRPGHDPRVVQTQILVLEAFVGPYPPGKTQIRHLDGNPSNNWIGNLKYATPVENRADMTAHGRDHYATRERCKYGHLIDEPRNQQINPSCPSNARVCRSCNCAASAASRFGVSRRQSPELFAALGDHYYAVFMAEQDPRGTLTAARFSEIAAAVTAGTWERPAA